MNGVPITYHPLQEAYRQVISNGDDWTCAATERWRDYWISAGMFKHGTGWQATAVKHKPVERGHPMLEPGDLWFEFGATASEAIARLKRSLSN